MISVVLPAKDEQNNIGRLIQEIHQALVGLVSYEIVITDDASTDGTVQEAIDMAKELGCELQIVAHAQSRGQSTAVHSAVLHAKGELIVTLDADGQNDPADIPAMLALAYKQTNPHFCIAGFRWQRKDTSWKRFQSKIANKVRQFFLQDGVPDSGCGLKIFPRQTFLSLPYFDHMHRFLPALIKRLDGSIIIHNVKHRDRTQGTSKYNAWNRAWVGIIDMFGVAWLIRRNKYTHSTKVYVTNKISRKKFNQDDKSNLKQA